MGQNNDQLAHFMPPQQNLWAVRRAKSARYAHEYRGFLFLQGLSVLTASLFGPAEPALNPQEARFLCLFDPFLGTPEPMPQKIHPQILRKSPLYESQAGTGTCHANR